jgi:predicted TIM-barrel fold metal-dependent hydrolase
VSAASPVSEPKASSADAAGAGWDCHVHVFDAAAPVRPGHYVPGHRTLAQIEQRAHTQGIGHLVLVQPSVYGTDNTVMLQALEAAQGRHRGVAVVDAGLADRELEREFDRLHAAGVRGVRFNRVSPAGHAGDVAVDLQRLAPRLRERGWHAQWYVPAHELPRLVGWQAQTGLRFVLDHLAGLGADVAEAHPAWAAARALADAGAWVKLSGWYRLGATAPYVELRHPIERVAALFGTHMVWGSDWPHTSFSEASTPDYASTLAPVREALGAQRLHGLLHGSAQRLYA